MKINHCYQSLADNLALHKYAYLEIQGYKGRDPEKLLYVRAYESEDSQEHIASYHLPEEQRQSVIRVAALHRIELDELPDLETKTKVQTEFEEWMDKIKEKEMDQISHYEKAVEFAKELSHGVVRGYWRNEIAKPYDIFDMRQNTRGPRIDFNVGRDRLTTYLIFRIGYGTRSGQSYTTKRGANHYHSDAELGDVDLMISTMVGIGMLEKVDDSNNYELTGDAFALLKKPQWHEKHAKLLSKVSIVSGILSVVAVILSIILMLKDISNALQG